MVKANHALSNSALAANKRLFVFSFVPSLVESLNDSLFQPGAWFVSSFIHPFFHPFTHSTTFFFYLIFFLLIFAAGHFYSHAETCGNGNVVEAATDGGPIGFSDVCDSH